MAFKYRVIEETYRDSRRMAVGEEWVSEEKIHDSIALFPADVATEEAYLETYGKVPTKVPVHDAAGRVIDFKEGPHKVGRHVRAILEKRQIPREDHEAHIEMYGMIAEERRDSAVEEEKTKAKELKSARDKAVSAAKKKREEFLEQMQKTPAKA